MFSARTRWNLQDNPLTRAVAERRARGLPVLDLTDTNPTHADLPFPHAQVANLLTDPRNREYQPEPFGLLPARLAVAQYQGHQIPPEHVILTASTSEAYAWLFKLLCDPGDHVLVPTPSYPLFEYLAALETVHALPYPSRFAAGEWHLDVHALQASITPKTRALLLVSPGNPTGAALHPAEREAVVDLCVRHDLALISDEVFADTLDPKLVSTGERVPSLAGEARCLTFALSGLSKTCLLPQLKLGWMAASGPQPVLDEALARLEVIADTYLSLATPVQHAMPGLLALRPGIAATVRDRLALHRTQLRETMEHSSASVLPSDGGWCAILRVPRHPHGDEARALQLLQQHGVLVQPGWFFDLPEGHLVLGLLADPRVFTPGLRALRHGLDAA
jgi:alanine-synthesizing transaminase